MGDGCDDGGEDAFCTYLDLEVRHEALLVLADLETRVKAQQGRDAWHHPFLPGPLKTQATSALVPAIVIALKVPQYLASELDATNACDPGPAPSWFAEFSPWPAEGSDAPV